MKRLRDYRLDKRKWNLSTQRTFSYLQDNYIPCGKNTIRQSTNPQFWYCNAFAWFSLLFLITVIPNGCQQLCSLLSPARMSSSPIMPRVSVDILEELQLFAAQNLEKVEVSKYYEVIRELGKGTYGKVDLVIHKIRGTAPFSCTIN